MAVVVEVSDDRMSSLARRLIGRRSGVHVIVTGTGNGSTKKSRGPEHDRRILVQSNEPHTAAEILDLMGDNVWAVISDSDDDINAELRDCVDRVRTGSSPLLSRLASDRGEAADFLDTLRAWSHELRGRSGSGPDNPLSERETQILQRISQGVTSQEIADEMGFQLQTVKNKVTTILTKTEARSRTHAVAIALTNGWIRGT